MGSAVNEHTLENDMSYLSIPENAKRGDWVELRGIAGERELVSRTDNTITLKRKGYAENPGSRYSGLKTYYPAEFEIFSVVEIRGATLFEVKLLDSFEVRPPKP